MSDVSSLIAANRATPLRYRGRVFVDFWNYELSMKQIDPHYLTDWRVLGRALVEEAIKIVDPTALVEYQGIHVYSSYDARNPNDEKFRHWMVNTLDKFPGVHVSLSERQKKQTGPKCPVCHGITANCHHCGGDMRGTEEKGVDVSIATDMMGLAWANSYDVGVLVSSDRDFIPVAKFLDTKDIKIIHGAFPPRGSELTQKCWGSVALPAIRHLFQRMPRPAVGRASIKAVPDPAA